MIKAVIFDLGRVLIPFDFDRGYAQISARTGLSRDEIRGRFQRSGLVVKLESGQIDPEDFVEQAAELLGMPVTYDEFSEIWSSIFLPETLVPESMVEGIRKQRRTVLLSNTNHIHYSMLEKRYTILNHFDGYCLSHKVGAMKPDPRIYEHAVSLAQCQPAECFFTDDIPDYIEGARRMGIDAVQFQNADQIAAELRARGIEC
jgi:putative hydrolase of the HAD superfamily